MPLSKQMKNVDRVICAAFILGALAFSVILFQARPRADSDVISSSIHKIPSPKSNEVPGDARRKDSRLVLGGGDLMDSDGNGINRTPKKCPIGLTAEGAQP